jgi:hypothetical protein
MSVEPRPPMTQIVGDLTTNADKIRALARVPSGAAEVSTLSEIVSPAIWTSVVWVQ